MRSLAFLLLILAALSSAVAARADDMSLRWDGCAASGTALKSFACDTNAGASDLVVSLSLSAPRSLTGIEVMMEVVFPASGTLPSWWNVPACRPSSVFAVSAASGSAGCVSPWAPSAAGGAIFESTFFGPTIGRLRAALGVPPADSALLSAGVEYGALRISISHVKATGVGSCGGCSQPAGIDLRTIECYDANHPEPLVILPATPEDHRYFVGWQCEGSPHFDQAFVDDWSFVSCDVAARRPTWGAIKSLYR